MALEVGAVEEEALQLLVQHTPAEVPQQQDVPIYYSKHLHPGLVKG